MKTVRVKMSPEAVERSLTLYLNALIPTTKNNELVPLSDLARKTPYSQEYLSLLSRRGRIPSIKINGIWHSTRKNLQDYMKTKSKR